MGALRMLRRRMQRHISPDQGHRSPQFELLEPRLLLSADFLPDAPAAMASGRDGLRPRSIRKPP
jgi:hypothetical protein